MKHKVRRMKQAIIFLFENGCTSKRPGFSLKLVNQTPLSLTRLNNQAKQKNYNSINFCKPWHVEYIFSY